jgi:hypothetical protein
MLLSRARSFGLWLAGARVRRMLLFAGLAFAALPAGSALATTVGQTGTPASDAFFVSGAENVQTDAAMPTAGLVTSLQFQSSDCENTFGGFLQGSFDFQVLRPLGNNQYLVLGDTGNQTDPCNSQLNSYPVNIPVQAGDVIGAYVVNAWQGVLSIGSGNINFDFISEPAVGDTITVPSTEAITLDESATLASGDQLVNDTIGLKPGTALNDKATAIQAAVNAGDTATACADITNFLGLVKAQTGKKLNATQAATLTTDANNLAAALGC